MNVSALSSNALYAKSKAMNAKRITERQYADMAALPDIGELASYLKNRTSYSAAFEGIGGVSFNRARLEGVIKRMIFLREQTIMRYAELTGSGLGDYFTARRETDIIISCARRNGETFSVDPYLLYLPDSAKQSLRIDLSGIEDVKSDTQMLEALEGTPYHKLLTGVLSGDRRHFVNMQNILYKNLFEQTAKNLESHLSGEDAAKAVGILSELSDIITLSSLYRIKKYYPDDEKMIFHVFRANVTKLDKKCFDELCAAKDAAEVEKLINNGKYGKYFRDNYDSRNLSRRIMYTACKKHLSASFSAVVSAICCDELFRIEATNLSTVAEGISYKMSPDEIMSLLIKE